MAPKGPSGRGPHRLGGPYTPHMGCVLTRLSVLHCVRNGKPRLILPGLLMAVYIAFGEYRCRTERRCPAPIGPSNTDINSPKSPGNISRGFPFRTPCRTLSLVSTQPLCDVSAPPSRCGPRPEGAFGVMMTVPIYTRNCHTVYSII